MKFLIGITKNVTNFKKKGILEREQFKKSQVKVKYIKALSS